MADRMSAERVQTIAAAARVPIDAEAAARVARGVAAVASRFAAEPLDLTLETEPASFVVVQRRELPR